MRYNIYFFPADRNLIVGMFLLHCCLGFRQYLRDAFFSCGIFVVTTRYHDATYNNTVSVSYGVVSCAAMK